MKLKECTGETFSCGKFLPVVDFPMNKGKPTGRCRVCTRERDRAHYHSKENAAQYTFKEAVVDMRLYALAMYAFNKTIRIRKRP